MSVPSLLRESTDSLINLARECSHLQNYLIPVLTENKGTRKAAVWGQVCCKTSVCTLIRTALWRGSEPQIVDCIYYLHVQVASPFVSLSLMIVARVQTLVLTPSDALSLSQLLSWSLSVNTHTYKHLPPMPTYRLLVTCTCETRSCWQNIQANFPGLITGTDPPWPNIVWALRHHYKIVSTTVSTISGLWCSSGTRPSPDLSPQLQDKIWQ